MYVDRVAGVVILTIHCGDHKVGYRRLTIRFSGATIVPGNVQLLAYAVGAEFTANHWHDAMTVTDIRACEIDVDVPDRFVLRMRLWPFHEFAVEFADLSITETPSTARPAAHAGLFGSAGDERMSSVPEI